MIISNQRRQRRHGGVLVAEMAFVAVIFFLFMFAIFEYGRVVMMQQIMKNAARAGARTAVVTATSVVNPATATANVNNTVTSNLAQLPLVNVTITIYQADDTGNNITPPLSNGKPDPNGWTATPFGKNVVVQIDADCPNLFPTGVPTGKNSNGVMQTVHLLPNNSTTTPNAVHLTAITMMRGEAN